MNDPIDMSWSELVEYVTANADEIKRLRANRPDWAEYQRLINENNQLRTEINNLEGRVEHLTKVLEAIANYPDPDFPVGDLEGELDRAERIYMQIRNIAQFGLK